MIEVFGGECDGQQNEVTNRWNPGWQAVQQNREGRCEEKCFHK